DLRRSGARRPAARRAARRPPLTPPAPPPRTPTPSAPPYRRNHRHERADAADRGLPGRGHRAGDAGTRSPGATGLLDRRVDRDRRQRLGRGRDLTAARAEQPYGLDRRRRPGGRRPAAGPAPAPLPAKE